VTKTNPLVLEEANTIVIEQRNNFLNQMTNLQIEFNLYRKQVQVELSELQDLRSMNAQLRTQISNLETKVKDLEDDSFLEEGLIEEPE
jgi:phage shock protein A